MAKNLVIVESPAKAKTIEGFLGKEFTVKSSFGHVRDLPDKGISIDIENGFKPVYVVSDDKKKIVEELKKLSRSAETVWLATDEDREGEAISWHLKEALDLDEKQTRRITFNEITKTAIQKAITKPRKIDIDLVNAQQARRVLDRLVGFELSPVLWKKVKPSLSAGRVQSVAVRLIVEREREIQNFQSTSFYKTVAVFKAGNAMVKAELNKRFAKHNEALAFVESCKKAVFTIEDLVKKPAKKSPSAPFTTSTLQQEASRKLGFSVARTMSVAQKLYEAGHITYMRTDSVNLSETAINGAKAEITRSYGANYSNPKQYTTKSKGAQEAHEAIRPTYMNNHTAGSDAAEQRLYDLIWKRTIASQMADALLERTTVTINVSGRSEKFIAEGEIIKFDGFLKVYLEGTDEETDENTEGMLPPLKVGEKLNYNEVSSTQRFTHHPPRYTEASLVKKLEELGIGRPSTYAPTISTVQKRNYVVKEDREGKKRQYDNIVLSNGVVKEEKKEENTGAEKSKLFPTDIGMLVTDFLIEHFVDIMDYGFTASVEKEFDNIAQGLTKWNEMIKKFYKPFHKDIENTLEHSERVTGERILGKDPATGKPVIARIGRFGPMVQIGEASDEEKPRFASLRKDQSIQTITFEQAMELFKLPRHLGDYLGKKVTASIGRFGPYISYDGLFASIKAADGDDPMTITLDRAIELIIAKKEAVANSILKTFSENDKAQILKGRWGAYLKFDGKNFRIPKGTEVDDINYNMVLNIVGPAATAKKAASKKGGASKAKGKTSAKTKAEKTAKKTATGVGSKIKTETKAKPAAKKTAKPAPKTKAKPKKKKR
ncbi:MAG TPA: type I DNA topoisomerase [Flavobacteriales bacterium]|nr:type I DNA topoisomerase [Flavobacteriales bacterium]